MANNIHFRHYSMIPEGERHACLCSWAIKCFRFRGVGGQHTLCWCVLHRFLCSNQLITSIIGSIQWCQKVRGMHNRIPKLFSTYGPGGVGGQYDPFQWVLHLFLHSKWPIIYIIGSIQLFPMMRGVHAHVPKIFSVFRPWGRITASFIPFWWTR